MLHLSLAICSRSQPWNAGITHVSTSPWPLWRARARTSASKCGFMALSGRFETFNVSSSPDNALSEVLQVHTMDALSEAVDAHSKAVDVHSEALAALSGHVCTLWGHGLTLRGHVCTLWAMDTLSVCTTRRSAYFNKNIDSASQRKSKRKRKGQ